MPNSNDHVAVRSTSPEGRAELAIVLLMMLLSAVLSFRVFFPHLRDIVIFDEAYYIDKGQRLLHGELPVLAENPLVAGFWAVLSLPFGRSPNWMMHAYGAGRFLVFAALWVGMYAAGRSLRSFVHPLVPLGFLLVCPGLLGLLDNSTDGVFAALSAFALARFLAFVREGRLSAGVQTSVLLGLAALARNDGLFLLSVAVLLTPFLLRGGARGGGRQVVAIFLPAFCLVGAYIAIQALASGSVNLGIARRSYDAFEQGEGVVRAASYHGRNPYVEGYDAARQLYGTPEENGYSIARAVFRNPVAFGRRLMTEAGQVPAQAMAAYGRGVRGVGAMLCLFALRGLVALWGRHATAVLLVLVFWCSHLLLYGLTFYREGYFLLAYAPVFWLAALGAWALFDQRARREAFYVAGVLGLLILYGISTSSDLLWWPGVALLAGMVVVWTLLNRQARVLPRETRAVLGVCGVLLLFSLLTHFSLPARLALPRLPRLGARADEMAARFLAQTQREGTPVASYTMAPVTLARMYYVAPHIDGRWIASMADFMEWAARRNVHVFYVDKNLRECEPKLWEIMRGLIGTHLRVGFHAEDDYESVDVLFH